MAVAITATIGATHGVGMANQPTPSTDVERIELAPSFFLLLPRFISISGGSIPAFLGEYQNETGRSFDSPVLGLTFYDGDENIVGSAYATPVLSVTTADRLTPITGEFYNFDPNADDWEAVEYFLCDELNSAYRLDQSLVLDLELQEIVEDPQEDSYIAEVKILNSAANEADGIAVYGIFRDGEGIFQGYGWAPVDRPIPSGKTYSLTFDVGVRTSVPFDPFDRIEGTDYTVDLIPTIFAGGYGINC